MKIKICGIRRTEDVRFLNESPPDYAGFVFANTRRRVSFEEAERLRSLLKPEIKTVGVFVNEDMEFIRKLVRSGVIDLVQLHGDEDEKYIRELNTAVPVIKAQRIIEVGDIKRFETDFYLFDTYRENMYGGTGEAFDWEILKNIDKPYFLAGGITVENIERAMEKKPYAIDVSSGAETNGVKDRDKIRKLIYKVRNYNE